MMYNVEMVYAPWNRLENYEVHLRGLEGSIEGPRRVLDLLGVNLYVLRVPWYVFLLSSCLIKDSLTSAWWGLIGNTYNSTAPILFYHFCIKQRKEVKILISCVDCDGRTMYCQTPGYVFRLGVDFVLPLSQEEEQEEQEEEPLTKIYQKGEC